MVNIPGYTHIKGGRVSILVKEGISYKRRKDLNVFQGETESLFIEILSKNGKKIIWKYVQTSKHKHHSVQ